MSPDKRRAKRVRDVRTQYEPGTSAKRPPSAATRSPLLPTDWLWVQAHRDELEDKYAGRWIAVSKKAVVGSGVRLSTALRQAQASGATDPFVTAFRPRRLRKMPVVPQWL